MVEIHYCLSTSSIQMTSKSSIRKFKEYTKVKEAAIQRKRYQKKSVGMKLSVANLPECFYFYKISWESLSGGLVTRSLKF
jgi:hypothetical protein